MGLPRSIATFDMAKTVGWARWDEGLGVRSGAIDLSGFEHPGERYGAFRRIARKIATTPTPVEFLAWERILATPRQGHTNAARTALLLGLESRVVELSWELGIELGLGRAVEVATLYPSSLKKQATGRGNAEKEEVAAVVERRWDRKVRTFDESDALAVLGWVLDGRPE